MVHYTDTLIKIQLDSSNAYYTARANGNAFPSHLSGARADTVLEMIMSPKCQYTDMQIFYKWGAKELIVFSRLL